MTFREALKLSNDDFAKYADEQKALYRAKMLAAGMVYFPAIDRWYPAGTEIAGVTPESAA